MKAIIFDQGITLKDVVESPIYHDHIMVSPIKVLVNGIENAIYTGILWVQPGRILGSTGIAKVDAVGIDSDSQLEGKHVLVLPYSKTYGGIGTEHDGILAEKSVIPQDAIVTLPSDYPDKYVLYPYVSIGMQVRKIAKGMNILIVGGGLTGLLVAHMLVGYASRVLMYRDDAYKVRIYGVEEVKNLDQQLDAIMITTMRSWARTVIRNLKLEVTTIIPKLMNTWPVIVPDSTRFVEPVKMNGVFEYIDSEISEKFVSELLGFSDDIFSSIPTSKPAVLVNVKKSFEKI